MSALLIDLDGVLYQGGRAISGAVTAIDWLRGQNIPLLFVTNTSSRPRAEVAATLAKLGLAVAESEILTPAVAATAWLKSLGVSRVALFVREATKEDFPGLGQVSDGQETGADAVVIGDLGDRWDFALLNRAFRLLMANPAPSLVALGMTRYWRAADGLRLDTGPFVAALREATGIDPVVMGKPSSGFFQAALGILGQPAGDTLMIGDDIRGDIDGAQSAGIRGVLVRTGKFRPEDLRTGVQPYAVLDSIADLVDWWGARKQP